VAQTESAWLPSVKAEIRYRETNVGANDAETFPTETVSARLVLTWDIFDSGARAARQQEASARLQDAQLALDQINREIDRLKASSASEVNRIRQAWEAARAEVASAEQLVAAADRSFELGVGTIADTLLALDRLVEAEIRLTSRWLEGANATAQLAQSANRLDRALIELISEEFAP
jgi:adhesin transport system outer membrane protein